MRRNIESKNVWQQILGRKNLGSKFFWVKIRRAKWGTHFFERNFLGRKFWGACFGEADSFVEEILPAKFLENFLRVKCHSGKEKNTGKQKCFGGKIWGAKFFDSKLLSLMVSP